MSRWQIVKKNVFTLFNFLNAVIALLLLAVGAYCNVLFITIVILNTVIGIFQEFKAKAMVEKLSLLNRPSCVLWKDGKERTAAPEEVKEGDILILRSGSQAACDVQIVWGSLEADESMLTGESEGVVKELGDKLLSGSMVLSGTAWGRVLHPCGENYVDRLAEEVKKTRETDSQLLKSMKSVTGLTSFFIIPVGILLFVQAAFFRQEAAGAAVVSSCAALLGMLPKGLVLLISVSLAAGVIRLGKKKILVKDIYSLETLAHADVLCLDKTGTITMGKMRAAEEIPLWKEGPVGESQARMLAEAYLKACGDSNATFQAMREAFLSSGEEQGIPEAGVQIPFSSKRKWGAVSFPGLGTVYAGAPERLLGELPPSMEKKLREGFRLVAMAYSREELDTEGGEALPDGLIPLFALVLEDRIREHARETLEYFQREGVEIKILSGDHVRTASLAAKRAGLSSWEAAVDLSAQGEDPDYAGLCREYSVFARVTPEQKRRLIQEMKAQGRQVAMAGDGVNDLLALREADCSIALGEGSDASRQISQIVLLDSDFTYIPQVVLEGRRVINNVTRTGGVFFIKTIYSLLTSMICLIFNIPFPFIPIQITLVDAFVEAFPSFFTILEADTRRPRGMFLEQAIKNALPFGLAVTLEIGIFSLAGPFDPQKGRLVMYLLLALISMGAVVKSCFPFTLYRAVLCTAMACGFFGALAVLPGLFQIPPDWERMVLNGIQRYLQSGIMDRAMVFITSLGDGGRIWIVIGLALCAVPRYRKAGIWLLISLQMGSLVSNYMLKPLIARPRPYEGLMIPLLIDPPGGFSFPSGHTASSFAAAAALALAGHRMGIPALVLASLIAFSRMYLYVHYPTDILGGTAVGLVCAAAVGLIIDKGEKWYRRKRGAAHMDSGVSSEFL